MMISADRLALTYLALICVALLAPNCILYWTISLSSAGVLATISLYESTVPLLSCVVGSTVVGV